MTYFELYKICWKELCFKTVILCVFEMCNCTIKTFLHDPTTFLAMRRYYEREKI